MAPSAWHAPCAQPPSPRLQNTPPYTAHAPTRRPADRIPPPPDTTPQCPSSVGLPAYTPNAIRLVLLPSLDKPLPTKEPPLDTPAPPPQTPRSRPPANPPPEPSPRSRRPDSAQIPRPG